MLQNNNRKFVAYHNLHKECRIIPLGRMPSLLTRTEYMLLVSILGGGQTPSPPILSFKFTVGSPGDT
jgi:hypothetical protein